MSLKRRRHAAGGSGAPAGPQPLPDRLASLHACPACRPRHRLDPLPGFDVWLGNVRANAYSRNHTALGPGDAGFWAFTWDDIAAKDLPAMLGYELGATGAASLAYVGHSQVRAGFGWGLWLLRALRRLGPALAAPRHAQRAPTPCCPAPETPLPGHHDCDGAAVERARVGREGPFGSAARPGRGRDARGVAPAGCAGKARHRRGGGRGGA
jgi:hypothetical protein